MWKRIRTVPYSFGLLSALSVIVFLSTSHIFFRVGFPLDDAWIHQTYARNLVSLGEWAFLPGRPSAGSTAPLWSVLLSLGHFLRLGPYIWTYFLGWICLWTLGVLGWRLANSLLLSSYKLAWLSGAYLLFEWHLVWSAVSGMETLLTSLMALAIVYYLGKSSPPWFGLGSLTGLNVWVRPDGLTLVLAVIFVLLFRNESLKKRAKNLLLTGMGVLLLVLPYLYFNFSLSGSLFPNTFFAKQAEYAIYQEFPLWARFFDQAGLLLVGAGVLLLPGFLFKVGKAVINKDLVSLAAGVWVVGFLFLYAVRLPVIYQHGRYIMPCVPVYSLWGLAGTIDLINRPWRRITSRVLTKAWGIAIPLLLAIFWLRGAFVYALDVAFIETEMVDTARWIATNTEQGALIAAHDIGALGYFGRRNILDLAGLISPEVIPFIRDEGELLNYLNEHNINYLMTFPAWYPELSTLGEPLYWSNGKYSIIMGGENMVVYRWFSP